MLSCTNDPVVSNIKDHQNKSVRSYDTTDLPKSLINDLDEFHSATYDDIMMSLLGMGYFINLDSAYKLDTDSIEQVFEEKIKNRVFDKDSILRVYTSESINNYKLFTNLKDSLKQLGQILIKGEAKGTIYHYDFNLRENNSFDIMYISSFGPRNFDLDIYYGTYKRQNDTIELFFESQKPSYFDDKYIININGALKSYHGSSKEFREFIIKR